MKVWVKALLGISLSFMCLFSSLGYASFADTLEASISAKMEIPYGLFITSVTTDSTSRIDRNEFSHLPHTTTLDTNISRTYSGEGAVTYRITVLNNTKLTYSYRKIYKWFF